MSRTVVLTVTSTERAAPYLAALAVAGVPAGNVRVVPARSSGATAATPAIPPTPATPATSASPATPENIAGALLDGAAALVLGGGDDVDPRRYGEEPLPGASLALAPERDACEWELLLAARARRLPVFGICRGFQVLNVFFGGTLWQDLALQLPGGVAHELHAGAAPHRLPPPLDLLLHPVVAIAPEAPLGALLARQPALVNSRHHQAVKRLAAPLLPVAIAPDGLVEAAILPPAAGGAAGSGTASAGWWVRGVQWHPENLIAMAQQRALWEDLGRAAATATTAPAAPRPPRAPGAPGAPGERRRSAGGSSSA